MKITLDGGVVLDLTEAQVAQVREALDAPPSLHGTAWFGQNCAIPSLYILAVDKVRKALKFAEGLNMPYLAVELLTDDLTVRADSGNPCGGEYVPAKVVAR